ncbi:hypothetical protein [Rhizobium anhuiense]|uniref:hypothetical protein n=1 Tax=Rhizobium anhuiense TaxID=1184720 RepID=UPI003CCE5A26
MVKNELHKDPLTGTVFVFQSRKADRLKLIKDGGFHWPRMQYGEMHLTSAHF